MPVKFWHTNLRFWFFLSYLITTVPSLLYMCTFVEQKYIYQSNFYERDDVLNFPTKLAEQIQS